MQNNGYRMPQLPPNANRQSSPFPPEGLERGARMPPFTVQKTVFQPPKDGLLEAERWHIGKPLIIRHLQRRYKPCCGRPQKTRQADTGYV